jgi:hypothetical protein
MRDGARRTLQTGCSGNHQQRDAFQYQRNNYNHQNYTQTPNPNQGYYQHYRNQSRAPAGAQRYGRFGRGGGQGRFGTPRGQGFHRGFQGQGRNTGNDAGNQSQHYFQATESAEKYHIPDTLQMENEQCFDAVQESNYDDGNEFNNQTTSNEFEQQYFMDPNQTVEDNSNDEFNAVTNVGYTFYDLPYEEEELFFHEGERVQQNYQYGNYTEPIHYYKDEQFEPWIDQQPYNY